MIEAKDLVKTYGNGESRCEVLKGISLRIENGAFVVILGASGSGKSTLLHILSGLEMPDSGSVSYDGREIAHLSDRELTAFRKKTIGFVFQQYYLLPHLTIGDNVKLSADLAGNREYEELLLAVGLGEKRRKYPHELSGGEQQRAAIARALAKHPRVLFCDEPTGALDEQTGRQVLACLCDLQEKYGFTVVMVTHNQNLSEMADTVIRVNSGKIAGLISQTVRKNAYEIGW